MVVTSGRNIWIKVLQVIVDVLDHGEGGGVVVVVRGRHDGRQSCAVGANGRQSVRWKPVLSLGKMCAPVQYFELCESMRCDIDIGGVYK